MADLVVKVTVELVLDHPAHQPLDAQTVRKMAFDKLKAYGVIGRVLEVQSWRRR